MTNDNSATADNGRAILVIGATGQVGGAVVRQLLTDGSVTTRAAVRRDDQRVALEGLGATPVHLDLDDGATVEAAMAGVDGVLLMTGYTVDMMKQSKRVIDAAARAGVDHLVHIGASGNDTAEVAHWGWHRMIEAYADTRGGQSGMRTTHIRPEAYMQNLTAFGWLSPGTLVNLIGEARWSWVDARDVATMAAAALLDPEAHAGKVWRLGTEAATMAEVAAKLGAATGTAITLAPLDPQVMYDGAVGAGADAAYMACIRDQFRLQAQGAIPGTYETFDPSEFERATGRAPTTWGAFIAREREALGAAVRMEAAA